MRVVEKNPAFSTPPPPPHRPCSEKPFSSRDQADTQWVGQFWSNFILFMYSFKVVGERLHYYMKTRCRGNQKLPLTYNAGMVSSPFLSHFDRIFFKLADTQKILILYNGTKDVSTLAHKLLIGSSSDLQVTRTLRTGIKSRTSLNTGQIRPATLKSIALERQNITIYLYFQIWIFLRIVGQS